MRKILNFKILNFASIVLATSLLSCNAGDCTNGIQDGNETGIDCGGNCSACVTIPPPGGGNNQDSLQGDWIMVLYHEITYPFGIADTVELDPLVVTDSATLKLNTDYTFHCQFITNAFYKAGHTGVYSYSNPTITFNQQPMLIDYFTQDSLIVKDISANQDTVQIHYFRKAE